MGRGYVGACNEGVVWRGGACRGMATENTGGRAGPTPACGLMLKMLDPT